MKLLLQKMQNFRALGALPPDPQPPAAGGFALRPPLPSGGWVLRCHTSQIASPLGFLATRLARVL